MPRSLRPPEGKGPHTNSGDGAVGQVSNKGPRSDSRSTEIQWPWAPEVSGCWSKLPTTHPEPLGWELRITAGQATAMHRLGAAGSERFAVEAFEVGGGDGAGVEGGGPLARGFFG